jgi:type IV pilus assembly protein PilO
VALNLKFDLKSINIEAVVNLPVKVKVAIVAGIIVVVWGLYIGFVVYPKYKVIKDLKTEAAQVKQKRDEKRRDAEYLPKLKAEVAKLEKELNYSMSALPNTEEIPKIVNAVQENLRKFNLDILSFRPEKESKKDFYAEIPISLRFTGGFREIGEFCQAIGRHARIINILNISVKDPKYKDGRVTLTADTRAVTYRFLKPDEIQKKEQPKKPGAKK